MYRHCRRHPHFRFGCADSAAYGPEAALAVVIPKLVERHWFHHLLHNKRASVLKALLLLRGNERIVVINVPWYLDE